MILTLITGPGSEPVTVAEAKLHVRQDGSADDALLDAMVVAAREMAEAITRRALISQTWEYRLDSWPAGDVLHLPLAPLQSVTSIKYVDEDGAESTLSADDYVVDSYSEPGRVRLKASSSWPSTSLQVVNGVVVRFVCGWANANAVPQTIKNAMLLMIGHWYENREMILTTGAMPKDIPFTVEALLWPQRVIQF